MNNITVIKEDLTEEILVKHLSACNVFNEENEEISGFLSVDCEMMGLNPRRDRLCLVQMCDENNNVTLLQILAEQNSAPNLKKLLEHPKVSKIFHFARADMAFLQYHLDIAVNPVFCTKIASKLARTYTEGHGLKSITKEFLSIELNKYQQSSDWGKDKLSNEQMEYAASDVLHLIKLKDILVQMLEREGRLELAQECFKQIYLMSKLDLLGFQNVFEHNSGNVSK